MPRTQVSELGIVLLLVKGMSCASCVGSIEGRLKELQGVTGVKVNLMSGQARVEHDPKVRKTEVTGRMSGPIVLEGRRQRACNALPSKVPILTSISFPGLGSA